MDIFAQRLRILRQNLGVTQETVADAIGVTSRTYIRYEKGEREPVISLFTVIADYFDVSADYLLGRSDQRK